MLAQKDKTFGCLLHELDRTVPLLVGVEVELKDPHRPVTATDRVLGRVPHHDLDGPVSEHINLLWRAHGTIKWLRLTTVKF